MTRSRRGQRTNPDNSSATECSEIWCLCQCPEDGRFMICCDVQGEGCKIWYHGDCVGVTQTQGRRMERDNEDYLCPVCLATAEAAVQLPPYTPLSTEFSWSDYVDGATFSQKVTDAYDEVVHWRSNLFLVPYGRIGKEFVQELSRLISAFGEGSALEGIAIKATMIQCTLLLQRPYQSASTSDFISCLKR